MGRLPAAERRASILAAATEVFAEVGYQRGTMAEVARRVGVSEPVVFQNFGSKAAVFAAVIEDAHARMAAGLKERAATYPSIGAFLRDYLAADHGHAHGHPQVMFTDALAAQGEPQVQEAFRRAHRAVARVLADLVARGQADGSVRPDLDPPTVAWWLLSLLASHGFRAVAMPDRARLEAQISALTLRMLMAR